MDNELDTGAVNLTKSILQQESGGNYSIRGNSGEYGGYQFIPSTWNEVAPKYGINVPLEQSTPEQQNAVAYNRIKEWKDAGNDVTQIASMWNAGQGEPNAYTGKFSSGKPSVGVNNYGVKYDVPSYVEGVARNYLKYSNSGADIPNPASDISTGKINNQPIDTTNTDFGGGIIPKLGGIDTTLSNMGGVLGAIGSGVYNAGKGIINLGKDAVVDMFNTINHPVDAIKKAGQFIGEELQGGAPSEHLDSIGHLIQDTVGSKGALGVGEQIGNAINDAVGTTSGTFHPTQLAGASLNAILTAITGGSGGLIEDAGVSAINKAVENKIITEAMGTTLKKYAEGLVGKSLESGIVGAGFQAGSNLQEGRPIGENIKQGFFTGAAVPSEISGLSNVASKVTGVFPSISFLDKSSDAEFNRNIDKAFKPGNKEIAMGDKYYEANRNIMGSIYLNRDNLGITDDSGNIKQPENYNRIDAHQALVKLLPDIYSGYTGLLDTIDSGKFKENVNDGVTSLLDELKQKRESTISKPNKDAINTLVQEINSTAMKNTSPIELQNYIQGLGKRAFSGTMDESKAIIANTGGKLKDILDSSLEKLVSNKYNEFKTQYHSAKVVQNSWVRAAKSGKSGAPSLTDKLAGYGMTVEGINFLLSHDPQALLTGLGIKGVSKFTKWLNSPDRAVQNAFRIIKREYDSGKIK